MLVYFYIIFTAYLLFVGLLIIGWEKSDSEKVPGKQKFSVGFVSILVAVRNEEKSIERLLHSLENQTFPRDKYEVIIVDDFSEDKTRSVIMSFTEKTSLQIKLIPPGMDDGENGKKMALKRGLMHASGDIILTTDGDCWATESWIERMVDGFSENGIQFVSGPVLIHPAKNFFSKIQQMEFLSLVGSGASMIGLNYPLMCNGANIAYKKQAYETVCRYDGVEESASGDDVYLMQKIHLNFPGSIRFLKSSQAIVFTEPVKSLNQFINQRKRWASKWNANLLTYGWLIPVFLFIHYLSFIALIILSFFQGYGWGHAAFLVVLKFSIDFIFLKKISCALKSALPVFYFFVSEMIYPFYAMFIGISVHFGFWRWKGRNFKK